MYYPFNKKITLSILAASVLLTACGKKAEQQQEQTLPVSVLEVQTQEVPLMMEATGQTAGSKEVEVRPRISGILQGKGKDFVEGKYVKQGTLLYSLDDSSLVAQLKSAVAGENAQKAMVQQANDNFNRIKNLYAQKAISRREYESALASRDSAAANLDVAKAQAETARVNLSYTQIRAPISGYTSSDVQSQGSLVSSSNILTKISQLNPMYVNFSYSDNEWLKIRKGEADGSIRLPSLGQAGVQLIMPDGSEYPNVGKVNFNDSTVSQTTGTIKARATFDNPNNALVPGLFVRVSLTGAVRTSAILVPQRAVVSGVQGQSVWLVDGENKVQQRPVKTAEIVNKNIVITEGLKAGEHVVLDNIAKLAMMPPNSVVKPNRVTLEQFNNPPPAPAASAPAAEANAPAKQ